MHGLITHAGLATRAKRSYIQPNLMRRPSATPVPTLPQRQQRTLVMGANAIHTALPFN